MKKKKNRKFIQVDLPEYVLRLFWDIKKDNLDIQKHSIFIIKRVLDYGDEKSLLWLRKIYSEKQLKEVVKNGKGLSEKTISFWKLYYEI